MCQLSGSPSPDTPSRSARKEEGAPRRPLVVKERPVSPSSKPLTGPSNPDRDLCAGKGQRGPSVELSVLLQAGHYRSAELARVIVPKQMVPVYAGCLRSALSFLVLISCRFICRLAVPILLGLALQCGRFGVFDWLDNP